MTAIDLYAPRTAHAGFHVTEALTALRQAAEQHAGAAVQASSLGAEDMVITDLIARHALPIAVATLDTGVLHAQTIGLLAAVEQRYGIQVERWQPPAQAVLHFVRDHGERAMYRDVASRKACCALRKLEPLERMLQGRSAWVTGMRREQSDARAEVPLTERDARGRTKFNVLAVWSWAEVWQYIADHEVPYNPLHDQGFPSIGCAPCTRAVAAGEDFRAGRWWWESSSKECGLHVQQHDSRVPA